jgi:hypothetical protein
MVEVPIGWRDASHHLGPCLLLLCGALTRRHLLLYCSGSVEESGDAREHARTQRLHLLILQRADVSHAVGGLA